MPFHIMLALTILLPLDIMLALSYTTMPRQLPSQWDPSDILWSYHTLHFLLCQYAPIEIKQSESDGNYRLKAVFEASFVANEPQIYRP